VTCVWVQRVAADAAPYTYRTIPHGSAEVVCRSDGSAYVVGPQTGPSQEVLEPDTTMVGIRLRPGVVPAVFGLSADELLDVRTDVADVWGRAAAPLAGALVETGSPRAAAAALESAVARRLADGAGPDLMVAEAVGRLMPGRTAQVTDLPSMLSVSERHLRRLIEGTVGVPPKVLHRMLRFQGFLARACTYERPRARLAQLAADSGFADQPHLTREAARLAGRTPQELLAESERSCAHAHDHTASFRPMLLSP
jgi:AraC-like DNA-binding protein